MSGLLVMLSLLLAPSAVEKAPGQVMLFYGDRATRVTLGFQPGDHVAYLSIDQPPHGLLASLRGQPGQVVERVERLGLRDGVLRLALHLRDNDQRVQLLKRRRRGRWLFNLAFFPVTGPIKIQRDTLLTEIPGVIPRPEPFTPIIPTPRLNPCDTHRSAQAMIRRLDSRKPPSIAEARKAASLVDAPRCQDFLLARIAQAADQAHASLKPWTRWAYKMSTVDRWDGYPLAFSYTAMVAARILTKLNFLPEADVILSTGRILKSQRLLPFLALQTADVELAYRRFAQAEAILRSLLKSNPSPEIALAAQHRLVLAALSSKDDGTAALAAVRQADSLRPDRRQAGFWNLAGEVALSHGDRDRARHFFQRGLRSLLPTDRAVAAMRLTDMDYTEGASRKRSFANYTRIKTDDPCVQGLLRLRRRALGKKDQEALENDLIDQLDVATCPGERIELSYALSQFTLARQEFEAAIKYVDDAREIRDDRWGNTGPLQGLQRMIITQAVQRLSRNREPDRIVALREGTKKNYDALLPTEDLVKVAEAYTQAAMYPQAAEILLTRMRSAPKDPLRDVLNVRLLEAYLEGGDTYRAETVLRYFLSQRKRSAEMWQVLQLKAEQALVNGDPDIALKALDAAEKQTPRGDPKIASLLRRAEALSQLKQADPAAKALIQVMRASWHPPLDRRGVAVNVSSICARECSQAVLAPLLQELRRYRDGALLNDRLRFQLERRGALAPGASAGKTDAKPTPDVDPSIWQRLRKVAPELARPKAGDTKPKAEPKAKSKRKSKSKSRKRKRKNR